LLFFFFFFFLLFFFVYNTLTVIIYGHHMRYLFFRRYMIHTWTLSLILEPCSGRTSACS
jgi:hypothetical protein